MSNKLFELLKNKVKDIDYIKRNQRDPLDVAIGLLESEAYRRLSLEGLKDFKKFYGTTDLGKIEQRKEALLIKLTTQRDEVNEKLKRAIAKRDKAKTSVEGIKTIKLPNQGEPLTAKQGMPSTSQTSQELNDETRSLAERMGGVYKARYHELEAQQTNKIQADVNYVPSYQSQRANYNQLRDHLERVMMNYEKHGKDKYREEIKNMRGAIDKLDNAMSKVPGTIDEEKIRTPMFDGEKFDRLAAVAVKNLEAMREKHATRKKKSFFSSNRSRLIKDVDRVLNNAGFNTPESRTNVQQKTAHLVTPIQPEKEMNEEYNRPSHYRH